MEDHVCLQIATAERSFEFFTPSLESLYEWQRQLRAMMLSSSVTLLSGWLTLLSDDPTHLLKRWCVRGGGRRGGGEREVRGRWEAGPASARAVRRSAPGPLNACNVTAA